LQLVGHTLQLFHDLEVVVHDLVGHGVEGRSGARRQRRQRRPSLDGPLEVARRWETQSDEEPTRDEHENLGLASRSEPREKGRKTANAWPA
jgi:hypothetical protein